MSMVEKKITASNVEDPYSPDVYDPIGDLNEIATVETIEHDNPAFIRLQSWINDVWEPLQRGLTAYSDFSGIGNDSVKLYLEEISRIPLLSASEEVGLSRIRELGVAAQEILTQKTETLNTDQENMLFWVVNRGHGARKHLVAANSLLVVSIAKRYQNLGLPFKDLIQEGNLGLIRAVDKFDWRRGNKFSTHATWWIRQAITKAIADHGRIIRLPVYIVERYLRAKKLINALEQNLKREATDCEKAETLGMTPVEYRDFMRKTQYTDSLDRQAGRDQDTELSHFVADTSGDIANYDLVKQAILRQALEKVLATLTPKEAGVLAMRYGLIDGSFHTLKEVGQEYGLTRERIRQIETKAIMKLRHPSKLHRLRHLLT